MERGYWTDERLNDTFQQLHADHAALRLELNSGLAAMRSEMHQEFRALYRLLLAVGSAIVAALLGVIATLVGIAVL